MYKIKELPEDFIVKEIPNFQIEKQGDYPIFLLRKRNYTTEDALSKIANYFHIQRKYFGYAGIKDRKAVTEQYISINILKKNFSNISLADIELIFLGYNNEPIYIGRLKGNMFEIAVRNLDNEDIDRFQKELPLIPNLFGEQRFSKNNSAIGKLIVKKNFKDAVELILAHKGNRAIPEYLIKHPTDYIGSLRKIPLKLCKLYVHAYQSELFNKAAEEFIREYKNPDKDMIIPVIGFGTEFNDNRVGGIYNKIMGEENIGLRAFIIKGMHELSSEGNERNIFMKIDDFQVANVSDDELNKDRKKVQVRFSLAKGCYATIVIDYLMRQKLS